MCQASGFKLFSNKELPSVNQKFSQFLPKSTVKSNGSYSASTAQRSPMFAIIDLTEDYMKKLLTATPLKDFREEVEKLSHEQIKELVQFAVEIGVTDYHRCKLLQEKTGFDVMKASIAHKEEEAENAAE